MHECIICNYKTSDKGNYSRHKKSKKHLLNSNKSNKIKINESNLNPIESNLNPNDNLKNNVKNNTSRYKCEICQVVYSTSSNLAKHRKRCNNNDNNHDENRIIKLLQDKLEFIENHWKKQFETLEKENEFHKQLVISAGNMIQTSMSTLNQLILNYNNAPILEPLKDYSILEEKDKFLNNIIYYYKENKLSEYLGNFLVKQYKTKDPKKRSNWNSDSARLTYINRELINNKPNWVIDKKGVKMTEIIIEPYLNYIKTMCQDKIMKLNCDVQDMDENNLKNHSLDKMTSLNLVIKNINNKTLSKEINRYLAPHFYFDKNNVLILKENTQ